MQPRTPDEWPGVFEERLARGDVEGLLALYDPDARFVTPSGEVIAGREPIRAVLTGLVRAKARMRSRVQRAVAVGDVAILYTDFDGTALDAAGARVVLTSRAIEVLRRREDGTWVLIVGDPNGRGGPEPALAAEASTP